MTSIYYWGGTKSTQAEPLHTTEKRIHFVSLQFEINKAQKKTSSQCNTKWPPYTTEEEQNQHELTPTYYWEERIPLPSRYKQDCFTIWNRQSTKKNLLTLTHSWCNTRQPPYTTEEQQNQHNLTPTYYWKEKTSLHFHFVLLQTRLFYNLKSISFTINNWCQAIFTHLSLLLV